MLVKFILACIELVQGVKEMDATIPQQANVQRTDFVSKVPELTLIFWIIKIAATTLGETGGDAVTMSMDLGYLVGTAIFAAIFIVAVAAQIRRIGFLDELFYGRSYS